jgi:hypothetical protein
MTESILAWFQHWLPLIQGFAALASIAGALLSWKYAIKAQRARAEMTRNLVTAKLVETIERVLAKLHDFRVMAVLPDGKPDPEAYVVGQQQNKRLLEEVVAQTAATLPYLKELSDLWFRANKQLLEAAANPDPTKVEYACKYLTMISAELKIGAATREMSSTG